MSKLILILLCAAACAQTRPAAVPEVGGANLPAQKIGPNDLLAVQVYDSPEFSRTVRVSAEGQIRLPILQQRIKAEGLMPTDLEAAIADALQDERLIVDPFVTVTVAEYHSRPVSVAGAVRAPVTFQALAPTTLLEAITRAGGLSSEAGSEILISKAQPGSGNESLIQRIPVKGLIDAADPELNIKLYGGEEIRVPEAGKVYIVGNVRRPGAYPVQENSQTSVLRLLALAEGLAPFANKQAYIYRREGGSGSKNEIPIELRRIMERKAPDTALVPNDILYIPDSSGKRVSLAALEKALLFGSTAGATALVYPRR
jgi:polysaccharide export outer membrane protein